MELSARLADLAACSSVAEAMTLFSTDAAIDGELVTVKVGNGAALRFRSGHLKPRVHKDGSIDWAATTRIQIVGLEIVSG